MAPPAVADAALTLLAWYDRHARRLPWRIGPRERARGATPDPYRVWLSEVMLQQTTIAAVKPYFETFMRQWPHVAALARAPRDDVMKAWAGLGYYARARNLKACAEAIASDHGGRFPTTAAELRKLPGIGEYTAAAVAAIAYDEPIAVVDGNIERVITRLMAIDTPLPAAKPLIRDAQNNLTPKIRAGDYAQAMMDLGATICTVKRPTCSLCPLAGICLAHARGTEERYPLKATKADRPTRFGAAFVAIRADGAILLRQRGERGLLGGMTEVPGTAWGDRVAASVAEREAPLPAAWQPVRPGVTHVFTHFRLELAVFTAAVGTNAVPPAGHWWSMPGGIAGEALPSVMKKVIEVAKPGATKKRAGKHAA